MKRYRSIRHEEFAGASRRSRQNVAAASAARYRLRGRGGERQPLFTRFRFRLILAAVIAVALVFCVTVVTRSPLFSIRGVRITGLESLLPEEASAARNAAAGRPGTNLFRLNRSNLEAALKRVSAVGGAQVSRRFPNALDIAITPRIPVALLTSGSERWEVDRAGVAIRPARPSVKLPEIACAAGVTVTPGRRINVPGVAGAITAALITSRCKPLGTTKITKIEIDQNADMCLNMSDSVAIRIGQTDQLDTKLFLVRRIYDERPDIGAEVESIDLRFPESPACIPRGIGGHTRGSKEPKPSAATLSSDSREHESMADPKRAAVGHQLNSASNPDPEIGSERPPQHHNISRKSRDSRRSRRSIHRTMQQERDPAVPPDAG